MQTFTRNLENHWTHCKQTSIFCWVKIFLQWKYVLFSPVYANKWSRLISLQGLDVAYMKRIRMTLWVIWSVRHWCLGSWAFASKTQLSHLQIHVFWHPLGYVSWLPAGTPKLYRPTTRGISCLFLKTVKGKTLGTSYKLSCWNLSKHTKDRKWAETAILCSPRVNDV